MSSGFGLPAQPARSAGGRSASDTAAARAAARAYESAGPSIPVDPTGDYLTEEGELGSGSAVTLSLRGAAKYLHDVLQRACRETLDVYMLSGALPREFCDVYYKGITNEGFADSARRVLEAGCNVSIFLWDRYSKHLISPGMNRLMQESRSHQGSLSISWSGTREGHDRVAYFVIANARAKTPPRWICQVMSPQGRHIADMKIADEEPEVPALTVFDTAGATELSGELWSLFRVFERAAKMAGGPVRHDK